MLPEDSGTSDGISKMLYLRESRRSVRSVGGFRLCHSIMGAGMTNKIFVGFSCRHARVTAEQAERLFVPPKGKLQFDYYALELLRSLPPAYPTVESPTLRPLNRRRRLLPD